jgi:hypothetical protein
MWIYTSTSHTPSWRSTRSRRISLYFNVRESEEKNKIRETGRELDKRKSKKKAKIRNSRQTGQKVKTMEINK